MKTFPVILALLFIAFPHRAYAEDQEDIKAAIDQQWVNFANKTASPTADNPAGVWQASSAGGLWNLLTPAERAAQTTGSKYTNIFDPRHISIEIIGAKKDVAYATYYLTGTIMEKGETVAANYRTRVLQVFTKIGGKWLLCAAHFSPLHSGSGVLENF